MIPTQAAKEIGCTPQYVRDLIRAGKLKAKKVYDEHFTNRKTGVVGFYYEITASEVKRIKNQKTQRSTRGKRRAS